MYKLNRRFFIFLATITAFLFVFRPGIMKNKFAYSYGTPHPESPRFSNTVY